MYAYADGNPISYRDPSGEWVIPAIIIGGGAAAGGINEGRKAYKCHSGVWGVTKAVLRGMVAGGAGAAAGMATATLLTKNPIAVGAAGAATTDAVNAALGGHVTPGEAVVDTALGGAIGKAAEVIGPEVQGGSNFNPFTSPNTFGPRAVQQYIDESISHMLDTLKDTIKESIEE